MTSTYRLPHSGGHLQGHHRVSRRAPVLDRTSLGDLPVRGPLASHVSAVAPSSSSSDRTRTGHSDPDGLLYQHRHRDRPYGGSSHAASVADTPLEMYHHRFERVAQVQWSMSSRPAYNGDELPERQLGVLHGTARDPYNCAAGDVPRGVAPINPIYYQPRASALPYESAAPDQDRQRWPPLVSTQSSCSPPPRTCFGATEALVAPPATNAVSAGFRSYPVASVAAPAPPTTLNNANQHAAVASPWPHVHHQPIDLLQQPSSVSQEAPYPPPQINAHYQQPTDLRAPSDEIVADAHGDSTSRSYVSFTRTQYECMEKSVQNPKAPVFPPEFTRKRWRRLMSYFEYKPNNPPFRTLTWKDSDLWIAPTEEWYSIIMEIHLSQPAGPNKEHLSAVQTFKLLKEHYQTRRSRGGISLDTVRDVIWKCPCSGAIEVPIPGWDYDETQPQPVVSPQYGFPQVSMPMHSAPPVAPTRTHHVPAAVPIPPHVSSEASFSSDPSDSGYGTPQYSDTYPTYPPPRAQYPNQAARLGY